MDVQLLHTKTSLVSVVQAFIVETIHHSADHTEVTSCCKEIHLAPRLHSSQVTAARKGCSKFLYRTCKPHTESDSFLLQDEQDCARNVRRQCIDEIQLGCRKADDGNALAQLFVTNINLDLLLRERMVPHDQSHSCFDRKG